MAYQIITVSRMFGSGGRTIGKALAEALGIPYYDKEVIEMVAEESGLHPDFVAERGEYAPSKHPFGYAFVGRDPHGISNDDLLWNAQCRVIRDLASKGPCVIVGRCADYLLRDREDVLHVFISADDEYRKAYILEHYGETKQKPERRLAEKDKKRRLNYAFYTEREWGDPANYHLMLNSGKLGTEKAVDIILTAYRQN